MLIPSAKDPRLVFWLKSKGIEHFLGLHHFTGFWQSQGTQRSTFTSRREFCVTVSEQLGPLLLILSKLQLRLLFTDFIIIIIIIGTTALSEPRSSLEASASCPYSLQHSSSFSPPTSWHNDLDLYRDKTFHEPVLKSLNRFVSRRVLDSPAIASLDFATIFFPEQVVSLRPTPSNPGGPIGLLLSLDLHHGPVWHGKPYQ
jgi:hypothetical protein